MTEAQKRRILRLKRAEWAYQDRQRGYTTYRGGRPYAYQRRRDHQLKETILALVAAALVMGASGVVMGFGI